MVRNYIDKADLGKRGSNLSVMPIRASGEDLHLRSVRLTEVERPKEAYEDLALAYRKEIEERQGEWTVPHYLYYLMKLLFRTAEGKAEGMKVADRLFSSYPDSECVLAYQHMRAYVIAGR